MKAAFYVFFALLFLSVTATTWAIDVDGDGSSVEEESLAGTSDNDATQRPYWWLTRSGNSEDDYMGFSVSAAGDVNNDGYGDFIAAAPFGYSARVYSGLDGAELYSVSCGRDVSVSGAGDVNNDGYDDFIVGSPANNPGSVRVYSGSTGGVLLTLFGDESDNDDDFGSSVSGVGDINRDGYDDFIVGAPHGGAVDYGYANVYSGFDGAVLHAVNGSPSQTMLLGYSVSGGGDVNNDGYADFILGAPWDSTYELHQGSAQVYSGADGALLYMIYGDDRLDELGKAVSDVGDVNGDGYDDFIIGGISGDPTGAVRVYSGATGNILFNFMNGINVSGAGDVNGDGYDDFMVGDPDADGHNGRVYVYSGNGGEELYRINGGTDDQLGSAVSEVGDIDHDGYADFIIGAIQKYSTGQGYVRVFLATDLMNDVDTDFILNDVDTDNDNDGVLDINDDFPFDRNEWVDTDGDGMGNNADTDDDNDGMPDTWENTYGLNPLVNDAAGDLDGDGISNLDEFLNKTNPTAFFAENDFNNNGFSDVLIRSTSNGSWRLFSMSNGISSGNAAYAAYTGSVWQLAASEDFDADGDIDVLLRNTSSGAWRMFITENGAVQSSNAFAAYAGLSWEMASIADYNGDGTKDILLHDTTGGSWRVFYINNGVISGNASMNLYMLGWDLVYDGDIDGDGDADIILRRQSDGYWRMFAIEGGVVQSNGPVALYQSQDWQIQFVTDLDNDGDDDIVMRNINSGYNWRAFNATGGIIGANTKFSMYENSSWNFDHLNDVDNDGDDDVILRSTSGQWRLFLTNGLDVPTNTVIGLYVSADWEVQDILDLDSNRIKDVLMRNSVSGAWRTFLMDAGVVSSNANTGLYTSLDWMVQNK